MVTTRAYKGIDLDPEPDKVLVHRGLSTLDVLTVGLATILVFAVLLGALGTYVFSHKTNRIDVEPGARVFDHPLAPSAYDIRQLTY